MTKKEIYEKEILPLIEKANEIASENDIQMVAAFAIDESMAGVITGGETDMPMEMSIAAGILDGSATMFDIGGIDPAEDSEEPISNKKELIH